MWSSRNKLSFSAIFILFLILLFRFKSDEVVDESGLAPEEIEMEGSFLSLIRGAKEEIDYLHDIIKGKAVIAPVVEKQKVLVVEGNCQNWKRINFEVGAKHEWIQNYHWWLFSAHLDSRPNSLFPQTNSIQVYFKKRDSF